MVGGASSVIVRLSTAEQACLDGCTDNWIEA
jgi:hypothetical protein